MERSMIAILLAVLVTINSCRCQLDSSPKVEEEPVNQRPTELICDSHVGDAELDIGEYGGEYVDLGNGSVKCILNDPTLDLYCMAIMRPANSTDSFGNVTESITVTTQACWTMNWQVESRCESDSVCTDTKTSAEDNSGFCCCATPRCNRKGNIHLLPYVPVETTPKEVESETETTGMDETTIILVALLPILILFSLITAIIYYIYRKRRQAVEKELQLKVDQYNYDMRIYSDDPPLVNYDDMVMGACIHRGRFGDVFKAKLNDREVCVKYFHSQQRQLFYTEKEIYDVLDPMETTVVHCLACDERSHPDGNIQYIVIMEYISLGSLATYLKSHTLSWRELCSMAQTAAAGVGYLHSETYVNGKHKNAIVHRDLNSRNILVRPNMTCAIADMGFCLMVRGSKVVRNGEEEHAEDGSLRDVGTVRYMAPEILECAVNLRDCESSLKQIDMYAFALVVWELVTRCTDILFDTKRFKLPFEEELGSHPSFEAMRIHVAKDNSRPAIPVTLKHSEATRLLRETLHECWDADAEARLTALCVEERFKEMDILMEHKSAPTMSKNETSCYEKGKRLSVSSADVNFREGSELSPLIETDTPASETNGTTMTNLDSPEQYKPDVNIEMDRDRRLAPTHGRNIVNERNTMPAERGQALVVHDNTLMPVEEAKARQEAEEGRCRRQWENQQQPQDTQPSQRTRSNGRSVHLDIHNEVREDNSLARPQKENNLNVRRHNSQRNVYESSTSSNGGAGGMLTIPDCSMVRTERPRSLNLNIKPDAS